MPFYRLFAVLISAVMYLCIAAAISAVWVLTLKLQGGMRELVIPSLSQAIKIWKDFVIANFAKVAWSIRHGGMVVQVFSTSSAMYRLSAALYHTHSSLIEVQYSCMSPKNHVLC